MRAARWPAKADTIDELLDVARSYALDAHHIEHPQDIAYALINALEVAWRTVKPLDGAK